MNAQPLQDRRILCVENEYDLVVNLAHDLRIAGATVLGPVPSVEAALALMETEALIDAAVVDVSLGGDMADTVVDALLDHRVKVVLATGYGADDLDRRYPQLPRCEKPIAFRRLLAVLVAQMSG